MATLRLWSVYSQTYTVGGYSGGTEPPENTCSYVEVYATTPREAKVTAVRQFRKLGELGYCEEGFTNPFKGLKVEEIPPCPQHDYGFTECEIGQCIPYTCYVCEQDILPIGSGRFAYEDEWAHELCLLPEEKHAYIVLGDGYFA